MRSLTVTLTRLRSRLAEFPEAVSLISFLAVFLFFAISAEHFLTPICIANILTFASITGIVAIGMAMLMISGEFDLSVGSTFAVASYVFALSLNAGVVPMAAMLLALLVSALLGLVNGLIVTTTGIPSFITTVGTMLAYRGIARGIGGADFAFYTGEKPMLFDVLNGPLDALNRLSHPPQQFPHIYPLVYCYHDRGVSGIKTNPLWQLDICRGGKSRRGAGAGCDGQASKGNQFCAGWALGRSCQRDAIRSPRQRRPSTWGGHRVDRGCSLRHRRRATHRWVRHPHRREHWHGVAQHA